MRGHTHTSHALPHGFKYQAKLHLLKVAQAAMQQLGAATAGAGCEVAALEQHGLVQLAHGGLPRLAAGGGGASSSVGMGEPSSVANQPMPWYLMWYWTKRRWLAPAESMRGKTWLWQSMIGPSASADATAALTTHRVSTQTTD